MLSELSFEDSFVLEKHPATFPLFKKVCQWNGWLMGVRDVHTYLNMTTILILGLDMAMKNGIVHFFLPWRCDFMIPDSVINPVQAWNGSIVSRNRKFPMELHIYFYKVWFSPHSIE